MVAYRNNDNRELYRLQTALLNSFEGRAMAVRDVTKNKGKNTPGHDGIVWKTPAEKFSAIEALRKAVISKNNSYRSNVIKRV